MDVYFLNDDALRSKIFFFGALENVVSDGGVWTFNSEDEVDPPKTRPELMDHLYTHLAERAIQQCQVSDNKYPNVALRSKFMTIFAKKSSVTNAMAHGSAQGLKLHKISGRELVRGRVRVLKLSQILDVWENELAPEADAYLVWHGIPQEAISLAADNDREDLDETFKAYPPGAYKILQITGHQPATALTDDAATLYRVEWEDTWNHKEDVKGGRRGHKAIDDYWGKTHRNRKEGGSGRRVPNVAEKSPPAKRNKAVKGGRVAKKSSRTTGTRKEADGSKRGALDMGPKKARFSSSTH